MEPNLKRPGWGAGAVPLLLVIVVIWAACEDFGVEADFFRGTVRGELIIDQVVPEKTDEIRVAASKKFPPTDILSLIFTSALPVQTDPAVTSQRVPYDLALPLGEYAALFAIWKEKDKSFNPADIIGLHGDLQFFQPIGFRLTEEEPTLADLDFELDFSKVIRSAIIEGQITYEGTWPQNTAAVAVFVYSFVPDLDNPDQNERIRQLIQFSAFELLPQNVEAWDYRVRISHGTYKFIVVFWLGQGEPLTAFKVLGFYRDPNNPDQPGTVSVDSAQTVSGVDIAADFANIK